MNFFDRAWRVPFAHLVAYWAVGAVEVGAQAGGVLEGEA